MDWRMVGQVIHSGEETITALGAKLQSSSSQSKPHLDSSVEEFGENHLNKCRRKT